MTADQIRAEIARLQQMLPEFDPNLAYNDSDWNKFLKTFQKKRDKRAKEAEERQKQKLFNEKRLISPEQQKILDIWALEEKRRKAGAMAAPPANNIPPAWS